MPTVELLKLLAVTLGLPLAAVLMAVALLMYPPARILLGDILKLFAFAGRWLRKAAIASEVEGSVNSFVNRYNQDASDLVLPQCRVEWVTADNYSCTMSPGAVVVRVSLDRDHDRNFYNATTTFVRHAFLPRTKPFLTKTTARGIDLVMVHGILRDGHRPALRIFNEQFTDETKEVRKTYELLEEVEQEGLLKRILFRELHYFGESLGERAPRQEHSAEADSFLDWLHRLALRDHGEFTQLQFPGTVLKVGVILVAKDETFLQHDIDPYLRRALSYATQGFGSIYLLSRGRKRGSVVKRIAPELENLGGFEILAKRLDIRIGDPHSNEVITCVPLRVDPVALVQCAWDRIAKAKLCGLKVQGTVLSVSRTEVEIEVYGLQSSLEPSTMSGMVLPDATRYFHPGDQLMLEVVEADRELSHLVLSNVGTESDPKRVVDAFASAADQVVSASVVRFAVKEGFEIGLHVALEGTSTPGWIPRSKTRCGRFVSLSDKFPLGSTISTKVLSFDSKHNSWLCEAHGIPDPWDQVSGYQMGLIYTVIIREIAERHVVCELIDGAEAVVTRDEIAWGNEADRKTAIDSLQPSQTTTAVLLDFDPQKQFARLSFKRVMKSKAQAYFESVRDQVISAEVAEVLANRAHLVVAGLERGLILPISEVVWGYCGSLEQLIQVGATIKVVPFVYDPNSDNIMASAKRARPNDFEAVRGSLIEGAVLEAEVVALGQGCVYTNSLVDGRAVAGYVHKSQMSNVIYVTQDEVIRILPVGSSFSFVVKRLDDRHRVVELSRKSWLQRSFLSLDYGRAYRGTIHALPNGRSLFCANELEAFVGGPRMARGGSVKDVEVLIARKGANPREVEIERTGDRRHEQSRRR
jgi:small subunit ribosomal protein S1